MSTSLNGLASFPGAGSPRLRSATRWRTLLLGHPRPLAMAPADLPDDTSLSRVFRSATTKSCHDPCPSCSPTKNQQSPSTDTRKKRQSYETDPDACGIDVIWCVVGQCRCESARMDGARTCSWVFVCECASVHCHMYSQRCGPRLIHKHMFSTSSPFSDMPEKRPPLHRDATS